MKKLLDQIELDLQDITLYIDVNDNSLSRKWLAALNDVIDRNLHLEKNYCFMGFPENVRNGEFLIDRINSTVQAINNSALDYHIDHHFTWAGCTAKDGRANHDELNLLHAYFEDLQGVSGAMSPLWTQADPHTRWHIRQLNLLCHEFESWQLSWNQFNSAPYWVRPSQLMCWLRAPRFVLEPEDLELFGIETINRNPGAVFVGVNKAIGKHHWEVFVDEAKMNPEHRADNLVTSTLRSQSEAAADFDIEWGRNADTFDWQMLHLRNFRLWLENNGLDPDDKSLTIGHPQVAQVDLLRSFGTEDIDTVWSRLNSNLNVTAIRTSSARAEYPYTWADADYIDRQIKELS